MWLTELNQNAVLPRARTVAVVEFVLAVLDTASRSRSFRFADRYETDHPHLPFRALNRTKDGMTPHIAFTATEETAYE